MKTEANYDKTVKNQDEILGNKRKHKKSGAIKSLSGAKREIHGNKQNLAKIRLRDRFDPPGTIWYNASSALLRHTFFAGRG
ncbi:hypothetical protein [Allofournierella sp.]|uniref:hypothetical protein n=1 Tax=Allofournierella sp. TaxID=1940256 RepID=UPI003AB7B1A4